MTVMKTHHKIIIGDALEELKKIPEKSVDLVFADPPYNISKKKGLGWAFSNHVTMQEKWDMFSKNEFFDFNKKWISECMRVLKPSGNFFVCGSYHNIYQIGYIMQHFGLRIVNSIIWFKPNAQPNITARMFTESTEQIIWACNGDSKWKFNYKLVKEKFGNGKQVRNMWQIPVTPKSEKWAGGHPTQKPEALLEKIIIAASDKGDLILDPFAGTGTTNVVALKNDRNSIGIEINNKFSPIIKARMKGTLKDVEIAFC